VYRRRSIDQDGGIATNPAQRHGSNLNVSRRLKVHLTDSCAGTGADLPGLCRLADAGNLPSTLPANAVRVAGFSRSSPRELP